MDRFPRRQLVEMGHERTMIFTSFDPDTATLGAVLPAVALGAFLGLAIGGLPGWCFGSLAGVVHISAVNRRARSKVILCLDSQSVLVVNLLRCYRITWNEVAASYSTRMGVTILRSDGGRTRAAGLPRLGLNPWSPSKDQKRFIATLSECVAGRRR
jgi:hypothetical protein